MVRFNRSRYIKDVKDEDFWDRLIHKYHQHGIEKSKSGAEVIYNVLSCTESNYYNLLPTIQSQPDLVLNEVEAEYHRRVLSLAQSRNGNYGDVFMSSNFEKPITYREMYNAIIKCPDVTKLLYYQNWGFVVGFKAGHTLFASQTQISDDISTYKFDLDDGFYPTQYDYESDPNKPSTRATMWLNTHFEKWKANKFEGEPLPPIDVTALQ